MAYCLNMQDKRLANSDRKLTYDNMSIEEKLKFLRDVVLKRPKKKKNMNINGRQSLRQESGKWFGIGDPTLSIQASSSLS